VYQKDTLNEAHIFCNILTNAAKNELGE